MTLLIGVRCRDGVAAGADSKILRGGEVEYSDKLFERNNVVMGIEGLTGIRDDFLLLLDAEIARRVEKITRLYEMKIIVEEIVSGLTKRYADRVGESPPIGVLLAGLEKITKGKAILYFIHGIGYGERVNFICSGHGGPYATSLARYLLSQELTVEENAKLIAFVISWVSEELDATVGGRPLVAMIRDYDESITYLDDDVIDDMMDKAQIAKKELRKLFPLGFSESNGLRE
ncbi:MAG TPA: hypothetical protein EYP68_06440 [Candidatus Korarchaeota archaeon]|nr:hypothetical protein [Candidatus Korarchaeota archaeon]